MTRDERIAQLKPGDAVEVEGYIWWQCKFLRHACGYAEILTFTRWNSVDGPMDPETPVWVPVSDLLFPEPPPPPKATPGVRYRQKDVLFSSIRVGHISGRLFTPTSLAQLIDFDPAVWTPLDGEER
jgi:hypothetical protein